MKKILIISNMFPSKKYPHYGVFVLHTADVLQKAGNIVDVVSMKKIDGKVSKIFAYFFFYTNSIFKILFGKYDVVYSHYASHTALPILIAATLKKVNIISNVHGNDVIAETAADEKYFGLVRKLLNKSKYIICPSEYFNQIVQQDYSISSEKICVYPSGGVDKDTFRNIDRRIAIKHLGLDEKKRYIGYISRIEEKKGWDIFLQAASKIVEEDDSFRLIIVGDGSQMLPFSRMVSSLKLENKIIKYDLLPQDEIVYILNSLDFFVFSTYRKSESLGLIGLESMSCGTLTILPDMYGPASYGRDNENCIMFQSGSADSLEMAMRKASNLKDVSEIIAKAKKTADEFDHKNTDKILLDIFAML